MPSIVIQPTTVPFDAPFPPPNAQALANFVAASVRISGLETLTGIIVSTSEPTAVDRDKAWLKQDNVSLRVLGLYSYVGGEWTAMPVALPHGESGPAGAKAGELFWNTAKKAVEIYDGVGWTTYLGHAGTTDKRPEGVRPNYRFFDTTIGRELRWTGSAWTTTDGALGDVKMVDYADTETALEHNPGWEVFAAMAGRFPIAPNDDISAQSEGGQKIEELKVTWSAKGRSAEGGAREAGASFLASITINGNEARADGTKMAGLTDIGSERNLNLQPPYKALIFLKKVL
jgi:hypothetical protein